MERLWSEQLADNINYYLESLNKVDKTERRQMLTDISEKIYQYVDRQVEKNKEETLAINDNIHSLVNQRIALIDKFKELYPRYSLLHKNYNIMKQTEAETERKLKNLKSKYDSKRQSLKDKSKNASNSFFAKSKAEQLEFDLKKLQNEYEAEKAQVEQYLRNTQECRETFEKNVYLSLVGQWNSLCKEARKIYINIIKEKKKCIDCNSYNSAGELFYKHITACLKNFPEVCLTNDDEKTAFFNFCERGKVCYPVNLFSAKIDYSPLLSLIAICSQNPLLQKADNVILPSNYSVVCCNKFNEIKSQNATTDRDQLVRTFENPTTIINEKIYEPFFDFLYDTSDAWFDYKKYEDYKIDIEEVVFDVGIFETICIALQSENYNEKQIKQQLTDENIKFDDKLLQKVRSIVTLEKEVPKKETSINDLLPDAIKVVVEAQFASTTLLQRKLKISYTQASNLIDTLEEQKIIGGYEGAAIPRRVYLSQEKWQEMEASKEDTNSTTDAMQENAEPGMRLVATNYADFDYPESLIKDIEIMDHRAPAAECYMHWVPNFHSSALITNWVLKEDFLLYVLDNIKANPEINLPTLALTIVEKYEPQNSKLIEDLKEFKKLYEETPEEIILTEQRYYMHQDHESRLREEQATMNALEEQRRMLAEEISRREKEAEERREREETEAFLRRMEEEEKEKKERLARDEARRAQEEMLHLARERTRIASEAARDAQLAEKRAQKAETEARLRREFEDSERRAAESRRKWEEGNARMAAFQQCSVCANGGKCRAIGTVNCGAFVPR